MSHPRGSVSGAYALPTLTFIQRDYVGGVEKVIGIASDVTVTLSGDSIYLKPELGKGKPMAVDFRNGFIVTRGSLNQVGGFWAGLLEAREPWGPPHFVFMVSIAPSYTLA
jgi:hypothetical protein